MATWDDQQHFSIRLGAGCSERSSAYDLAAGVWAHPRLVAIVSNDGEVLYLSGNAQLVVSQVAPEHLQSKPIKEAYYLPGMCSHHGHSVAVRVFLVREVDE
jgi:hypothetical protein